jgi:hypothetical protein
MAAPAPSWREQYERMLRWRARLVDAADIDEAARDDFYAFFLNCFHLKDWIKADPSVGLSTRDKVEELFNRPTMRACADVANASKHLVLTRSVRFDANARLQIVSGFQSDAFQSNAFQTPGIVIAAAGQTWDALTTADGCVGYWQEFLHREGLL